MSYHENDLEVIVFGADAVGKTSLLSSMFMQMESQGVTSSNIMAFTPVDHKEFLILIDKWSSLHKKIQNDEFTSGSVIPYDGTTSFIEHNFEFTTTGYRKVIKFIDAKSRIAENLNSNLISRIKNSFALLCVVDAAILMECDDIVNEQWNCPMTIKRILMKILDDGDKKQPISCMFILTKCEKYMRTPEDRDRLSERFEQVFGSVLNYAADKRFPLFYIPVQTMGCVEFSRIDPITKQMVFKTVNRELQPVDVIFPMIYALSAFMQILIAINNKFLILSPPPTFDYYYRIREALKIFDLYYNSLHDKVGSPTDFRGNRFGTSPSIKPMDFWRDFPGN